MTVSTNKSFPTTKFNIIEAAVSLLNVYGIDSSLEPKNYERVGQFLNMMIKSWSAVSNNLWEKKTIYLFVQALQNTYNITLTSPDHCTTSYYLTTLSVNAPISSTSVTVLNVTNINPGDYIGIIMDNNYIYWTQVLSKVGNVINFVPGGALTYAASAGKNVYTYTIPMETPLDIYSALRNSDGTIDIPMSYLSYQEYFNLPNKNLATNNPVSYNYDRQLSQSTIRLWPTPDRAGTIIKFTVGRKISNLDFNNENPDFPDEWQEAIVFGLAVRIAPFWGKHKDQGFINLKMAADEALTRALWFDSEPGSIYFKLDSHHG